MSQNELIGWEDLIRAVEWIPIPLFLISSETIRLISVVKSKRNYYQLAWTLPALIAAIWLLYRGDRESVFSLSWFAMGAYGLLLGLGFGLFVWKAERGQLKDWLRANDYFRLFLISWFLIYIIYPAWMWTGEGTHFHRLIQFGLLAFFTAVSVFSYGYLCALPDPLIPRWNFKGFREQAGFWAIVAIFLVVQFPNLFKVMQGADELVHLIEPVKMVQLRIRSADLDYPLSYLPLPRILNFVFSISLAALIVTGLMLIGVKASTRFRQLVRQVRTCTVFQSLLIFLALTLASVTYVSLWHFHPNGYLFRFEPLGKILNLILYVFLGIGEFWPRLLQVVFTIASAYLLFTMANWFYERWAALSVAALFLFLSLNYPYLYMAYLDAGATFFMILPAYFFISYWRKGSQSDLALSFLMAGLGVLYKRPVAVTLMILTFSLLIRYVTKRGRQGEKISQLIFPVTIGVSLAIPWFVISGRLIDDNYGFTPSNYLSLEMVLAYPRLMAEFLPILISALFLLGLAMTLVRRQDVLGKFFLVWLLLFYLFLTGMRPRFVPYFRISIWLIPAIAVFAGLALRALLDRLRLWLGEPARKIVLPVCYTFFLVYVVFASAVNYTWPAYPFSRERDLYAELMLYLKSRIPEGYAVYSDFDDRGTLASSEFHRIKYDLPPFVTRNFPPNYRERKPVRADYFNWLHESLQTEGAVYALFLQNEEWKDIQDAEVGFLYRVGEAVRQLNDPRFQRLETFTDRGRTICLYEIVSRDRLEIGKTIIERAWVRALPLLFAALDKKTITPHFAGTTLKGIQANLGERAVSSYSKAYRYYKEGHWSESLAEFERARQVGIDVQPMLERIWSSEECDVRRIQDTDLLRKIAARKETTAIGPLEVYGFSFGADSKSVSTGSGRLFELYLKNQNSNSVDLVLFLSRMPIARKTFAASSNHPAGSLLRISFPVRVPLSTEPGKAHLELAAIEGNPDDPPKPGKIGEVLIERANLGTATAKNSDSAAQKNSSNLLKNPGFETGWEPWEIRRDEWLPLGVCASLDTEVVRSGKNSARIDFVGGTDPYYYSLTQIVSLKPGTRYKLSFYSKTHGLFSKSLPFIRVLTEPPQKAYFSEPLGGNTDWTYHEILLETFSQQNSAEIRVYRQGEERRKWNLVSSQTGLITGSLWIDDFHLAEVR